MASHSSQENATVHTVACKDLKTWPLPPLHPLTTFSSAHFASHTFLLRGLHTHFPPPNPLHRQAPPHLQVSAKMTLPSDAPPLRLFLCDGP